MKYYVTIYIDPLVECFLDCENKNFINAEDFTHAFLGLTKDKSPDELDKIDETLKQEYLKNKEWDKIDQKWYEAKEPNEFNDGFWGFGGGGQWYEIGVFSGVIGKVFNNNQYVLGNNVDKNRYIIKKLRSPQTFKPSNRCTLEISEEQYETLLANIKADFEATKEITPNSEKPINEEFTYKLLENNCVTWVVKKLSSIGIEVVNPVVKDPSGLLMATKLIQSIHSIFLKFQNIDDNLQSVKGAKAFKNWARMLINNSLMQEIYLDEYKKQYNSENLSPEQEEVLYALWNITRVYKILGILLSRLITKSGTKNLKGTFELIYFDKNDKQAKLLKASNHYEAIIIQELDLSKKYNNFSASKFYPFIFIPKDEMLSRTLYHKYDYGNISQEYQKDRNEFYFNVLAGEKSDKYWSSSYHKMTKSLRKVYVS
ncbi:hypothetical protein AAID93_03380 [Campylobacter coli]